MTKKEQAAATFLANLKAKLPEITKDAFVRGNVVYWESGPFEWAIDLDYAIHEEAAPELKAMGLSTKYKHPAVPMLDELTPAGFYHEAVNGYSIALCER